MGSAWSAALKECGSTADPWWAFVGYVCISRKNQGSGVTRNEQVSAKGCEAGSQSLFTTAG